MALLVKEEERRRRQERQRRQQRWKSLDLGGKGLKNLAPSLFHYTFLVRLQINHNNLRYLSPAIGNLRSLSVLDASGNGLVEVPPEIGQLTDLTELLLFDNQLRELPMEVGRLWQLRFLGLEGNPLEDPFATLIHTEGTRGVVHYARDHGAFNGYPTPREWRDLEPENLAGEPFTVMTYNVLSDKLATPSMYAYTPSWALLWSYRRERILKEIINSEADIICLQEVEAGEYEDFFLPSLSKVYGGHFWSKSRAKTMAESDRRRVDGCATFYRRDVFTLLAHQVVAFSEVAMQRQDISKSEEVFTRFMSKDNVSGIALLAHRPTGHRVMVANAHIHWDPEVPDVKMVQVGMLTEALERLEREWGREFPAQAEGVTYGITCPMPTLVCGDLNSMPDSGVYDLLSKGSVPPSHPDLEGRCSYGPFLDGGLKHGLALRSAYREMESLPGAWTNWGPHFRGVLDYIWYGSGSLTAVSSLSGIQDPFYTSQIAGLPSPVLCSDHIHLLSRIGFRVPAAARGVPSSSSSSSSSGAGAGSGSGGPRFIVGGGYKP